jgi:hypothetical protein
MRVWGRGKWGWFTAHCGAYRHFPSVAIPRKRLRKGEWRTLLNHAEQCRLWELPESLPATEFLVLDGSCVELQLQDAERCHRIERHGDLEPGLARLVTYLVAASTIFDDDLALFAQRYAQSVEVRPAKLPRTASSGECPAT